MILHYSMTGFLDTAQQAVSHEIHLSRLIRADWFLSSKNDTFNSQSIFLNVVCHPIENYQNKIAEPMFIYLETFRIFV